MAVSVLQVHLKTRMKACVGYNSSVLPFFRADCTSLSSLTVQRLCFIGSVTTEIGLQENLGELC